MRRRQVIAFCGKSQSGKDYSAARLMKTKGFKKVAYADALREVAFHTLGIPYDEGMKFYENLKRLPIVNKLTFRNILENLASGIRKYDPDFWARTVLKFIGSCTDNVCISDMRYPNEFETLKGYCDLNNIELKVVFCNYKSEHYENDNPHESAQMAKYLENIGYKDQEYVDPLDLLRYNELVKANK